MGSAWWVGLLWPIFFKDRAKKIVARIKLGPIGPTHLANFLFIFYFLIIHIIFQLLRILVFLL